MIYFNRRRPLLGGISQGRRKKREKKRENLEIRCRSPLTIPIRCPREEASARLREQNKLWRSQGEETTLAGMFLLPEKTFLLPTRGEEMSPRVGRRNEVADRYVLIGITWYCAIPERHWQI
ncbi:hypothetical protein BHE74_00024670 [Ensete ventricosum]|nr:hypothetical protein GW17_00027917 [Ensete ventricosum]RWW67851.1 hypothetical protein BHE74_00024670 [Ensete ventricosum]